MQRMTPDTANKSTSNVDCALAQRSPTILAALNSQKITNIATRLHQGEQRHRVEAVVILRLPIIQDGARWNNTKQNG